MKIQNFSFSKSTEHPDCLARGDGTSDPYEMEGLALKLQPDARTGGYFCMAGLINNQGYGLYLAPASKGVRYIIQEFSIGSHGDTEPESVSQEIDAVDRPPPPLIPYFADPAGLKTKFSKTITRE